MKRPRLSNGAESGPRGLSSLLSMSENSSAYLAAAQTALAAARFSGLATNGSAQTDAAGSVLTTLIKRERHTVPCSIADSVCKCYVSWPARMPMSQVPLFAKIV